MSYIEELRERLLAAEQRFGQIGEVSRQNGDRLMGLISRIEEEFRCRRDAEREQAKEIERLSDKINQLSNENEQLRSMLMSLLQAVEGSNPNGLDDTLNDMDSKVATMIGEGQGAPVSSPATSLADEPAEEFEAPAIAMPPADAMSTPVEDESFPGDSDFDSGADSGSDAMAGSDAFAPATADTASDTAALAEAPAASQTNVASEIADYFGAESAGGDDVMPAYAHPAGEWDEFLNEDVASPEAAASEPVMDETAPETTASEADTDEPETETASSEADTEELEPETATSEAAIDEPATEASEDIAADDEAADDEAADDEAVATAQGDGEGSILDEFVEEQEGSLFDPPDGGGDSAAPDTGSIRDLLDRVKTQVAGADNDQNLDDEDGDGDTAAAQ